MSAPVNDSVAAADELNTTLARLECAADGLDEIGQLTVVLRELIAAHDETGAVRTMSRGILARIEELSHVARHLMGQGSDEFSEDELQRVVTCSRPTDLDAALPMRVGGHR